MAEPYSPTGLSLVWVAYGLAALLSLAGLAGLVLTLVAQPPLPFAVGQAAGSVLVIASAALLLRSCHGRELSTAGLLPGELTLDGAFLYLAMTARPFTAAMQSPVRRESRSSRS
jgi:hypothetical protein